MKKGFILTPRASQDVNEIWAYIADDNIEAADRVLDAIESAMVKLAKNPGIGHWREELTDKRHRFLSRLFVPDRLSARNEAVVDHSRSSCRAGCAGHPRLDTRRALAAGPTHNEEFKSIDPNSFKSTKTVRGLRS